MKETTSTRGATLASPGPPSHNLTFSPQHTQQWGGVGMSPTAPVLGTSSRKGTTMGRGGQRSNGPPTSHILITGTCECHLVS